MEGGAEVGAVDGSVSRGFRVVNVFAPRAVEFYGTQGRQVGLAHGEERVGCAVDPGTFAEVAFLEFVELCLYVSVPIAQHITGR